MSHRPWNQPWPGGGGGGSTDWTDITGKPTEFAPSAHGHVVADVSGFTEAVQDIIGALIAAAGGSYDDAAGTITLPSGGGGNIDGGNAASVGAFNIDGGFA